MEKKSNRKGLDRCTKEKKLSRKREGGKWGGKVEEELKYERKENINNGDETQV